MFLEVSTIKKNLNQKIFNLAHNMDKEDSINRYLSSYRKDKLTKEEVREVLRYFLMSVRDDVESQLSVYLYNEAGSLKEILDDHVHVDD